MRQVSSGLGIEPATAASRTEGLQTWGVLRWREDASCPIELIPPRVVVKYGDPISVNCTTSAEKFHGLGWEASQGGTGVVQMQRYVMLTVESVTQWDSHPICFINIDPQCSTRLGLVIYTFPENISISSSIESTEEMIENEEYSFTCSILNIAPVQNLIVRWYKGNQVINSENLTNSTKQPTNQTSIFRFTPTRQDDRTTIRCEAHMDLGPEVGPEIECHTVEVQEGESLDGKCNVTGSPTPHIQWLINGHSINPGHSLRRNDTGTYEVKAEDGPEWTCPRTFIFLEFTRYNFKCSEGFPEPTEIWYKDEEEVQPPEILTRSDAGQPAITYSNPRPNYSWSYYRTLNVNERTEDGISRLIINNATRFNIGSYTCHAWNERGKVSKTVRVTVKGAKQECPIEIQPDTMVLQYQSSTQSVECSAQTNNSDSNVYWLIRQKNGTNIKENISWTPNTDKDWDPSPVCHATFLGIGWCNKTLHYILYKQPDNVSVNETVNNSASTEEGSNMMLECKIVKVAPAKLLRVRWLWQRGNETIEPDSVGIDSKSECSFPEDKSPVMVVCTMNITLNRILHGIQVKCEAELNLGPKGPQPPPLMASDPFTLSVLYKPMINTTKLPELVPVISGYKEELVCEADGNPAPKITWNYTSATAFLGSNGTLIVNEEGSYICIANNSLSTDTQDYLPLLAGFVALTVVAISIIFVFIYSIYYKNTKMRRYSLKNPKLSSHNGNVAHDGWDIQLPRAHGCETVFTPPMVYVKFGGSASANCRTTCNNTDGIGWESSFGGTGLIEGLSTLDVNLSNVNDWMTAPKCYIAYSNEMPEKVFMPKPPTPLIADGEYHLLQCSVHDVAPVNRLHISWHKGDEIFYEQSFEGIDRRPANKSVETTVEIVAEDNGKKVWCEARLDLPAEQNKPNFTEPENETLENVVGAKISLNCTATGNPTPVYKWHFSEPTLEGMQEQNATGSIFTLDFRTPVVYKCVASNVAGERIKYFHLNKPAGNCTTMAVLLGVFLTLGVVIIIIGGVFGTRSGSCAIPRTIY
ncbi:hypothetical protein CCH79_00008177 [Gambusia affinis]|uniref:Ig-like domain-containing protein n=1 Tax=Gambusia affinis TaxID=33528 RepID=A0A315V2B7_GAMAF|nr:hypothetical protein CCH79_00008177 [Gambusia affinis]